MLKIVTVIAVALVLLAGPAGAQFLGVVTETDTLPIPVAIQDSAANPIALAAGDSVYIRVMSPSGTSVFVDSCLGNAAGLASGSWEDSPGDYAWPRLVSDLDGSATTYGTYVIHVTVADISLDLFTRKTYSFLKVATNLNTSLAYLDAAVSSRSTVTTSDNIGVNLDDVSGTLDLGELGTTVIPAIAHQAADSGTDRTYNLAVTGLDSDSSFTNLATTLAHLFAFATDSAFIAQGFSGRTITPWALPRGHSDVDTMFYGVGNDTTGGVVYRHTGTSAWDHSTLDSVWTFLWP